MLDCAYVAPKLCAVFVLQHGFYGAMLMHSGFRRVAAERLCWIEPTGTPKDQLSQGALWLAGGWVYSLGFKVLGLGIET